MTELRIGNWVSFVQDAHRYKDYHQITNISTKKALCYNGDVEPELYPIPITPELLEKCGFEKQIVLGKDGLFWYQFGELSYSEAHKRWWFRGVFRDIEFLHQLQNIIFSLTGEELPIKF